MTLAEASDALSALAPLFRVRPELQSLCRFGAPWASPHGRELGGWAPFHMVVQGSCTLNIEGEPAMHLEAGDVVLLPHGDAHVAHSQSSDAIRIRARPIEVTTTGAITVKSNTDDPEVELICGRLAFEHPHENLARAALPRVVRIGTAADSTLARLGTVLLAIRDELAAAGPGALAISCDLASALLVMVLRAHFQTRVAEAGLLRLLGQRQTARVLAAIVADPGRPWSLDTMAEAGKTSRATLVRDFRRLARATPFSVLAELRLGLARHRLAATDAPIAEIAADVGYQSSSAFSRAFRRRYARSPGDMRDGREQ